MESYKDIYLDSPSLMELFDESRKLCSNLDKPFDMSKIRVTTDFGTNVVVYYDEDNENDV